MHYKKLINIFIIFS